MVIGHCDIAIEAQGIDGRLILDRQVSYVVNGRGSTFPAAQTFGAVIVNCVGARSTR